MWTGKGCRGVFACNGFHDPRALRCAGAQQLVLLHVATTTSLPAGRHREATRSLAAAADAPTRRCAGSLDAISGKYGRWGPASA
eukprot:7159473-Prymnesium_polylepis.1